MSAMNQPLKTLSLPSAMSEYKWREYLHATRDMSDAECVDVMRLMLFAACHRIACGMRPVPHATERMASVLNDSIAKLDLLHDSDAVSQYVKSVQEQK